MVGAYDSDKLVRNGVLFVRCFFFFFWLKHSPTQRIRDVCTTGLIGCAREANVKRKDLKYLGEWNGTKQLKTENNVLALLRVSSLS